MQVLPLTIAKKLGDKVRLQSEVISIEKISAGYKINYTEAGIPLTLTTDYIVSAVPAYIASEIFCKMDNNVTEHLNKVYYPPVLVIYIAYNIKDIGRPLDGFGFLIPAKEKKSFLGAIWSSVLFPNRAPEDTAAFTLFVGGARDPILGSFDKDLLFKMVRNEFETLMRINAEPVYLSYKFWPKAIPQYNIGYIEHENSFVRFEKDNLGLILAGNYRDGISVGDCIKSAEKILNKIKNFSKEVKE
jgi:oxygen-dependent protoporphyrinogen oxidase